MGAWPYVVNAFPNVAGAASAIASSPISWFSVITLAAAANIAIRRTQDRPSIFAKVIRKITGGSQLRSEAHDEPPVILCEAAVQRTAIS